MLEIRLALGFVAKRFLCPFTLFVFFGNYFKLLTFNLLRHLAEAFKVFAHKLGERYKKFKFIEIDLRQWHSKGRCLSGAAKVVAIFIELNSRFLYSC